MARKLLLLILSLALLIELVISFTGIFLPHKALQLFHLGDTPDTLFLGFTVGWLCLFVSLICALVLYRVWMYKGDYALMGYLLGFWWMGIGIGIFLAFKKTDNLLLDSLKGLLLVTCLYWYRSTSRIKELEP